MFKINNKLLVERNISNAYFFFLALSRSFSELRGIEWGFTFRV